MFKIFLKKKLHSGPGDRPKSEAPRVRNRRLFPRFAVDRHHLTAMNKDDILVIREISAKGFSSVVAPRAYERFTIGDVYAARIRYVGEIYDLDVKVTWKQESLVGFELVNASPSTLSFMRRLLKPIELAASLQEVDADFTLEGDRGKIWYHGDNETDLFIWRNEDGGVVAWQLRSSHDFVEWHATNGLKTGTISSPSEKEQLSLHLKKPEPSFTYDRFANPERKQFATDVFMAWSSDVKDALLATITR